MKSAHTPHPYLGATDVGTNNANADKEKKMNNRLDQEHGEQITKELKLGEVVEIKDDDGSIKKYKLVESGQIDGRSHRPLITLKLV